MRRGCLEQRNAERTATQQKSRLHPNLVVRKTLRLARRA
jgi:hypothetical protein